MDGASTPTRITIDFRGELEPAHGWIIGQAPEAGGRVELLSFDGGLPDRQDELRPAPIVSSAADGSGCTCPEFCERDHANE